MSLISEYMRLCKVHKEQLGERTCVLMQVGKFFEIYFLEDSKIEMTEICHILSMNIVRRDGKSGKNTDVTVKNPYFAGFPEISLLKNIRRLVESAYTVCVYTQTGNNEDTKKQNRELLGIYSQGTFVNDESSTTDGTTMMGIWAEELPQLSGRTLTAIGACIVDLSTGKVMIHESCATHDQPNLPYDELLQLIQKSSPKEVIISAHGDLFKNISSYFDLDSNLIHDRKETPKEWNKISYQNEVLEKIFGKKPPTPIEHFGLSKSPFMLKSIILVLEWMWEHVHDAIKGLQDPETIESNRLILGNAAIFQLNVLENTMLEGNHRRKGIRCLLDIVNQTTTSMGKRFLKKQLTSPLVDSTAIISRLNSVEKLVNDKELCKHIGMALTGVMDIERLHRRMVVGTLGASEFQTLHASYETLISMHKYIKSLNEIDISWINNLKKIVKQYKASIRMDRINKGWGLTDIRENLFVEGIDSKLDKMDGELSHHVKFMNDTVIIFGKLLECKLELVDNERDGYLIKTTKLRAEELKKLIAKKPIEICGVTIKQITVKPVGTACRISFPEFIVHGDARRLTEIKLSQRMRKLWIRAMSRLYKCWETELAGIVEGVSFIDFLVSSAKTAIEYKYCRPDIKDSGKDGCSSISCKQMRHPIIEQLIDSTYVPHDISLSGEGILLFGSNGSGKSSISKCLGLLTIMAQCGMYVPAKSMKLIPYTHLFARITGNDNILKGLSSYNVEMLELKSILRNAGKRVLVLGDEIARGTEQVSGTAIVAGAIEQLANTQTTFIFATHLHALGNLPEITTLKNVRFCHINSSYDKKTDKITYERDLLPGQGSSLYGIKVACGILNDNSFMERANYFVKNLLGSKGGNKCDKGEIVEKRKSKWNSDVYMTECTICQSKEDLNVHHIRHRAKCTDGYSEHVRQDSKGNLVVLCRPCHEETHVGAIEITGWTETTAGRELQWVRVEQKDIQDAIREVQNKYERSDWIKEWAYSDAVKKLGKLGHRVTAAQVQRAWASNNKARTEKSA
jgi:DNA mismatch repair protein MutS